MMRLAFISAVCFLGTSGFPYTCDELTPDLCELNVTSGTFTSRGLRVNYYLYEAGNTKSASSKLPIVMAHGGPGWSHDYMLPLKQQACRGRSVLFYDQGGTGRSERVQDVAKKAPWLLEADYYADELEILMKHIGWKRYHYLGSSWGTMLGQIYGVRQPEGLASMVLSGPLSDCKLYIKAQWDAKEGSLGSLPPFLQDHVRRLDAAKAYDSKEYASLDKLLTSFFTVRVTPPPDCFLEVFKQWNKEIYVGMQGASEFSLGGTLEFWNYTGRLHEIQVPVLLTSGKFDTMRPPCVRALFENIPKVEWHIFPHSGHCSMLDDAGEMNDVVANFYDRVESGVVIGGGCSPAPFSKVQLGQPALGSTGTPAATGIAMGVAVGLAVGALGGLLLGRRIGYKYQRQVAQDGSSMAFE